MRVTDALHAYSPITTAVNTKHPLESFDKQATAALLRRFVKSLT